MYLSFWETTSNLLSSPMAGTAFVIILIVLALMNWRQGARLRNLEIQLNSQQRQFRDEMKMVSQGAIGVGSRVKYLEQQLKKTPNLFEQALKQQEEAIKPEQTPSSQKPVQPEPRAAQSRAELTLASWMKDYRNTA